MAYGDRLKRWVVVRLLPDMQRIDMARFHQYADADGYAHAMRRICPEGQFVVMFEPGEWR